MRLEADGIQLAFDQRPILSDVYLKVEKGRLCGLLGRNGSGKSCLLRIIFGQLRPQIKSVRIDAQPQRGLNAAIRYLPQHPFVPGFLTLRKCLSLYRIPQEEVLNVFPELVGQLNTPMNQLSGGQGRLIETLLILLAPADFVLLDEPFSALAPMHVERLKMVIDQQKATKGIVISDHLYEHLLASCEDLYLLREGKTIPVRGRADLERLGYISLQAMTENPGP